MCYKACNHLPSNLLMFSNSENASNSIMPAIWLSFVENNVTSSKVYGLFESNLHAKLETLYKLMISLIFEKL